MSWDSYIDNLVLQSKDPAGIAHCSKACIIGIDGGAKWTSDTHPNALILKPEEAAQIAAAFKAKKFDTFMSSGIHLDSTKYQFLRVEENKTVMGRRKEVGGVTAQCSKTAIVIGFCPEGCQQGNVNKGVSVIADYLESMNM